MNGIFVIFSILIILVLDSSENNNTYAEPAFKDTNLSAKVVTQGLDSPTSMAFVDKDNILVLEKNTEIIRR